MALRKSARNSLVLEVALTFGPGALGVAGKAAGRLASLAKASRISRDGPNLNTLEDVVSEIHRNADIAVELTKRATVRGRIKDSPTAFGSRAHKILGRLNQRLDNRLKNQSQPFRTPSEQFRDAAGDITRRNAPDSIGADVLVQDLDRNTLKVLDLKTHGGTQIPIISARQEEFFNRFKAYVEEIYRQR